jgi:cbb3-type cytochrome oxidase subunit 3
MSAILIFWLVYGAFLLCGFAWMFWHSGRRQSRNAAERQRRRDMIAVRLMMEGKQ